MIIKPKIRGFICTTAHPTGCAAHVQEQIDFVQQNPAIGEGPKNVLIIGASTGYGLASRITAAYGCNANTLGIFFEKESQRGRPASAGYYNSVALEQKLASTELYAGNINGDAFSHQVKQQAIDKIKANMGKIDLVVYSLASPVRQHPDTGVLHRSTLKPVGGDVTTRTLDTDKLIVKDLELPQASQEEIDNTVAVMGGEDWEFWMQALAKAEVLSENCRTITYTYLGSKITWPIYWEGSIGKAKQDLDRASAAIEQNLSSTGGSAEVVILKGVMTQASSAIPSMALYLSLLFKYMKADNCDEGCIEQIQRLFSEQLYAKGGPSRRDEQGRIRMDELELAEGIQAAVAEQWPQVTTENLQASTDIAGYQAGFLQLFGFGLSSVDYAADVEPDIKLSDS